MRLNVTIPDELYTEIEKVRRGRYLSTQEFILETIRKELASKEASQ